MPHSTRPDRVRSSRARATTARLLLIPPEPLGRMRVRSYTSRLPRASAPQTLFNAGLNGRPTDGHRRGEVARISVAGPTVKIGKMRSRSVDAFVDSALAIFLRP